MVVQVLDHSDRKTIETLQPTASASVSNGPLHNQLEYRLYFSLLYPCSLLVACLGFIKSVPNAVLHGTTLKNPLREAVEITRRATPWVFMGR